MTLEIVDLPLMRALLDLDYVSDIIPVGSKGSVTKQASWRPRRD